MKNKWFKNDKEVESTVVNYLGTKMFIPGKVKNLGDQGNIFLRKFKWILESSICEIAPWVQKVDVDYIRKRITVSVYDVYTGEGKTPANEWLDKLMPIDPLDPLVIGETHYQPDDMVLTLSDVCGEPIYKIKIHEAKLKMHKLSLDYSSSDVLTHKLYFEFKSFEREDYDRDNK